MQWKQRVDGSRMRIVMFTIVFVLGIATTTFAGMDDKVTVCHRTTGNPSGAITLHVGPDAATAHVAHGDLRRPCPDGPAIVGIDTDRSSASVGSLITLTAITDATAPEDLTFRWEFGDGQTGSGRVVREAFRAPGLYPVLLTAFTSSGATYGQGATTLSVFGLSGESLDLAGFALPTVRGDANGDGERSLRDLQILRQGLNGLVPFDDDEVVERLDFDSDRELTDADARLLTAAILSDDDFPSSIAPEAGQPGRIVELFAPELLDPDVAITVQVNGRNLPAPPRPTLGSVAFYVPLDVLTPGSLTTLGGNTSVILLVDGVMTREFAFRVEPTTALAADPMSVLDQLSTTTEQLRGILETQLQGTADAFEPIGYVEQDLAVILAALDELFAIQAELESDIRAMLESIDPANRAAAVQIALANGLGEALDQLNQLVEDSNCSTEFGRAALTQSQLETLCLLELSKSILEASADANSKLCAALTALAVAAIISPFDGPFGDVAALFAAATACITYSGAVAIADEVLEATPNVGSSLRLETDTDTSSVPRSATITPKISISIPLCSAAFGLDKVKKRLAAKVLKSGPVFPLYQLARQISNQTATAIRDQVAEVIGVLFGVSGVDAAFEMIRDRVCASINNATGGFFPLRPSDLMTSVSPNVGTLSVAQQKLEYECPASGSAGANRVTISADFRTTCNEASGTTAVTCASPIMVPITIGDNGSLTDDIFEAAIDGMTVLTMNAPTVATSTTVELLPGTYTLQMRGLAAPDGIGTYFVAVGGGATLAGPGGCGSSCTFATGTNLTAGSVLSWTLTVPMAPAPAETNHE